MYATRTYFLYRKLYIPWSGRSSQKPFCSQKERLNSDAVPVRIFQPGMEHAD